ncbi:YbjO family protein [Buttiauxella noackiae]|uniref:Putative inner membrane protein n=1 Tax=Buttiauxella noackiae ATCC 51607 TaxID=1354255 RepID=A0A1B7HYR0_9ENTR|nr:YbjO family protein [Buttiauxella noackiae]OAT20839.1 putative inner membrane protein [Buttiauxella noackiae ATCC 51607]
MPRQTRHCVVWNTRFAEIFSKRSQTQAKLNAPTLVLVAAIAILSTRMLDLMLLFNMLGVRGVIDFVHRSVQTWNLTLIFLGSLVMLCIELRCAFVIMKGRNWGRWVFLATQVIAVAYLWAASLGWGYPELFSIPGESKREIFRSLMTQKLPDLLVLFLLFIPSRSRLFFKLQ